MSIIGRFSEEITTWPVATTSPTGHHFFSNVFTNQTLSSPAPHTVRINAEVEGYRVNTLPVMDL